MSQGDCRPTNSPTVCHSFASDGRPRRDEAVSESNLVFGRPLEKHPTTRVFHVPRFLAINYFSCRRCAGSAYSSETRKTWTNHRLMRATIEAEGIPHFGIHVAE